MMNFMMLESHQIQHLA